MEQLFYLSLAGNVVLLILLVVLIIKKTSPSKQTTPKTSDAPTFEKPQNKTERKQNLIKESTSEWLYRASLDDVAAFIKKSDWKAIFNIVKTFIKRAGSQHDKQIWKMLTDRLCQTEHPILSDEFIQKHNSEIIWVETLATDEEIKKAVADKWNTTQKIPAYVLRKNHQLVGFALSQKLIIDGTTSLLVYASHIGNIVKSWRKSLLTKTDSKLVEKHFDTLNSMMEEADVPQIRFKHWMISTGDYDGYNINHPKRYTYYEDDDYSLILAKL